VECLNKKLSTYWVVPAGPRLVIAVSVVLLIVVLVIVGAVTRAQTNQFHTQIILNLLNGQQYFGVPRVYQGDNSILLTKWALIYCNPSLAGQHRGQGGISSNQPVLMLVEPQGDSAGTMFWNETYSGGVVKITIIGTYSAGSSNPADGYVIYLFLKPTMWGVSPQYNFTINYTSTYISGISLLSVGGDVILPQSSTPYIVVQWDPFWQFGAFAPGTTGQWNVWIVNNTKGNNPSIGPSPSPNLGSGWAGWDGIGIGVFRPRPGDRINITVTYDPSTNMLTGVAYDMNTGQWASFTLNLTGYYTPPSNGNYVFGVGVATGWYAYADWSLLYVAMTGNITTTTSSASTSTTPSAVLTGVIVVAVIVAAVLIAAVMVLILAIRMIKRSERPQ